MIACDILNKEMTTIKTDSPGAESRVQLVSALCYVMQTQFKANSFKLTTWKNLQLVYSFRDQSCLLKY